MLALFWASYYWKDIKTWSSCIRYSCSVYVSFMYGSSLLKVMAAAVWAAKGRTQTSKQDKALYGISQWLTLFVFMKLFSFQKINPLKCLPSFFFFSGPNHYSSPSSRTKGRHPSLVSLLASFVTLFPSKSHPPLFQNVFDFSKKEPICDIPLVDILASPSPASPLVPLQHIVIYSCSSPCPPVWVVLELDPNSLSASSSSAYSPLPPPVSRPQGDPAVFSSNDLS